jgi:hypothetical protein
VRIARLAKESGSFPVLEAEHGEVVSVSKIRGQVPVEGYLRPQARYVHLFGEHPRTDVIARLQAIADRNIRRFTCWRIERQTSDGRQAIRNHPGRRVEPGQQDRVVPCQTSSYLDLLPPCNHACPAGENIQQWLYHAEREGMRPHGGRSWPTTRCPP